MKTIHFLAFLGLTAGIAGFAHAESYTVKNLDGFERNTDRHGSYLTPEGATSDPTEYLRIYTHQETLPDEVQKDLSQESLELFWELSAKEVLPGITRLRMDDPELNQDSEYPTLNLTGDGNLNGETFRYEMSLVFGDPEKANTTTNMDFVTKSKGPFLVIEVVGHESMLKKYDKTIDQFFESIEYHKE